MGWFNFKLVRRPVKESVMKAELEAQIEALTAERDRVQGELDTTVSKLNTLMAEIPAEFHTMTQDVFDKLKQYFQ